MGNYVIILKTSRLFGLFEKAVYRAQGLLEKSQCIQPFLMLLTDRGKVELYENEIEECHESYAMLENILKERIEKKDIDIMVLVADTGIPENSAENISTGLRIHLEEKSRKAKQLVQDFFMSRMKW